MKLFSFKTNKIDIVYTNRKIKSIYIKEQSLFNNFIDKVKSNSYIFFLIFVPIEILKGLVYSIYLKLK